jgi:hypothetical protein
MEPWYDCCGGGSICTGKLTLGLITNVASDSCAVQCALTMRSIMALGKSAGSSSFHMSTDIPYQRVRM